MKESNNDNKKNINKTDFKTRADTRVRPYRKSFDGSRP